MKDDRFDSGIDIRHEVLRTRSYIMNDTICLTVSKENWILIFCTSRANRGKVNTESVRLPRQNDYLIMKKLNLSFFVLHWFWNSVILSFY